VNDLQKGCVIDFNALKVAVEQQHRRITGHATLEMAEDRVPPDKMWESLLAPNAEIIEDYPSDPRGPSCLILSFVDGQPIHVVVAHPSKRQAALMGFPAVAVVITVYRPDQRPHEWSTDYRRRL
jgi:hypothetical protein